MIERVKKHVYDILDQTDSFPYTPPVQLAGLAITNDGNDTVTVVVSDGHRDITINCTTTNRNYDADFRNIISINVTAGSVFQIELRSVL
jgi:hypothetical protein